MLRLFVIRFIFKFDLVARRIKKTSTLVRYVSRTSKRSIIRYYSYVHMLAQIHNSAKSSQSEEKKHHRLDDEGQLSVVLQWLKCRPHRTSRANEKALEGCF